MLVIANPKRCVGLAITLRDGPSISHSIRPDTKHTTAHIYNQSDQGLQSYIIEIADLIGCYVMYIMGDISIFIGTFSLGKGTNTLTCM